jgi:hypothetical protein
VWTATGLLTAAVGLVSWPAGLAIEGAGVGAGTVALVAYSWWVWRNDPNPIPALDT